MRSPGSPSGSRSDLGGACGRLHGLDHLGLVHALHLAAGIWLGRAAQLHRAAAHAEPADRLRERGDLWHRLRRAHRRARPAARDPARSAGARGERVPHDLPLSARGLVRRDRHGVELAAQSGLRHPEADPADGLDWFPFRLAGAARHGASTPSSSRGCGRARGSRWRCSSPGCVRWTPISSRPRRSTARARSRIYRRVVLPTIWPIGLTVLVILLGIAISTFDLVRALTEGGPGISTTLPALVVYDFMFQRGQLGRGAAAAVFMLLALLLVMAPFGVIAWIRARRRRGPHERRRQCARARRGWRALADLCGADRARGRLPAAARRRRAELGSQLAGDHRELPDRLAARAGARQFRRGLGQVLHRRALRRHPALYVQLARDGDPGDDPLDAARRARGLCRLALALPRRPARLRHRARSASSCPSR